MREYPQMVTLALTRTPDSQYPRVAFLVQSLHWRDWMTPKTYE